MTGWGWLSLWFTLNLGLTVLNKAIFQFLGVKFPILLSFVHLAVSGAFSTILVQIGAVRSKPLSGRERVTLLAFSVLFGANIVVGNLSLRYVSVSLSQVVRSVIPGITAFLSTIFLRKTYPTKTWLSLVPVILGVAIASLGEIDFHLVGFFLTVFVCVLSSLKVTVMDIQVVLSNIFLSGDRKLNAMDFLHRVAPISSLEVLALAMYNGEFEVVQQFRENEPEAFATALLWVLGSGVLAFMLNFSNFMTNQKTSPLTVTVAGNVKHAATIALSLVVFRNPISSQNAVGMVITVLGASWYSYVEYTRRGQAKPKAQ